VTAPASLPDLSALAASLDAALGVEPAPTTTVRPRTGPLARVGLALEPWPGLAAWIAGSALDAVLLHRHWSLREADVPAGVGVLANHDAFDRRLGFGRSPELAAVLGLALGDPLGERDGFPLATLGDGAPRSATVLRAALVDAFGGIEAELAPPAARPIVRVAMARAMTAALVVQAVDAGAQAYVTGQLRAPARDAAERSGLHVFAVGHRASERWALTQLATRLREGWPALDVRLAPGD
jgi:putative NIF3 family GTP cyclohydrolase 1 type 2